MSQTGYYASMRNTSETRHWLLAGPFPTHEMALALVDAAKRKANELDPCEAVWASFGTCSIAKENTGEMRAGILNSYLGITLNAKGWAQVPAAYKDAYRLRLNARITGAQAGAKFNEEYQRALASDAEKVRDYIFRRRRNSGCSGYLSTRMMQRRYPHINRQEVDF